LTALSDLYSCRSENCMISPQTKFFSKSVLRAGEGRVSELRGEEEDEEGERGRTG